MNKSLTEMQDIQKQIAALRWCQRSTIEATRNQIMMLQWGRVCPKCGRGVGECCVSPKSGKRGGRVHVARLNGHYKNLP